MSFEKTSLFWKMPKNDANDTEKHWKNWANLILKGGTLSAREIWPTFFQIVAIFLHFSSKMENIEQVEILENDTDFQSSIGNHSNLLQEMAHKMGHKKMEKEGKMTQNSNVCV